ncbi:hypothetical protein EDB92DRAFT_1815391 [Lactarius akahatsu]|uniref:Uncharacterized protein n=1 Tax=Lactarius akahatsu TaxID=416441 RepID=A0AAD4LI65_9AGAM|nr:hypothetical protein EDB92DRAFT_1815391 [Lactarius akahatsu]
MCSISILAFLLSLAFLATASPIIDQDKREPGGTSNQGPPTNWRRSPSVTAQEVAHSSHHIQDEGGACLKTKLQQSCGSITLLRVSRSKRDFRGIAQGPGSIPGCVQREGLYTLGDTLEPPSGVSSITS